MAKIMLKGEVVSDSVGDLPVKGTNAPDFVLVDGELNERSLSDFEGKKKILNIVPSLDTGVCAASARRFNKEASDLNNTVVLVISADLPFAQGRFCSAEGLDNVVSLSSFRSSFGKDYQLEMIKGPLKGLLSRSVIVLDENNTVIYTEQVPEVTQEPDYDKALAALV